MCDSLLGIFQSYFLITLAKTLRKWYYTCGQKFKDGQTNVHDEGGQGHKSVATEDLVRQVN